MDKYFEICISLANKAARKREVPISAIIVKDDQIIAKAYNLREKTHDIMAHAEILAIKKTAKKLKRWNLSDCKMFVTLKPCSMCNIVIKQSRIQNVFYLYDKLDYKKEYDHTNFQYTPMSNLSEKYGKILSDFFAHKR